MRAFRQNLGARLLLAMMLVLCVWLLSGCGVESSAELELSQDGAGGLMGSRTISCSVEQDQLSRRFTGGEEALDALLEQACPQELTWEKEAGEGWLTYRFRLDFDSQEEYIEKLQALLGRKPGVLFAAPDTVLTSGFRLREDFSNTDLLSWLSEAAVQQGLLQEGEQLFACRGTTVRYNGVEYQTGDSVDVGEFTYHPIDKITIQTQLTEEGAFSRTVAFQLPQSTVDELESELEAYFDKRVPQGGEGGWSDCSTGRIFTVQFTAETVEQLSEKTACVLDSPGNDAGLDVDERTLFDTRLSFWEDLNFSSFASSRSGRTFIDYRFTSQQEGGLTGAKIWRDGAWQDAGGQLQQGDFVFTGDADALQVQLQQEHSRPVAGVSVNLQQLQGGEYRRTIALAFADAAGAQAGKAYFDKAAPGLQVSMEGNSCMLSAQGSAEQLSRAFEAVFGSGNNLTVQNRHGFTLFDSSTLTDNLSLGGFLEQAGYNGDITYQYVPFNKLNSAALVQDGNQEEAAVSADGTVTLVLPASGQIGVQAVSRWVNWWFAAPLCFLLLLLLSVGAYAVYRLCRYLSDKGAHNAQLPATRFTPSGRNCPACGIPLYEGLIYCHRCGCPVGQEPAPENGGMRKRLAAIGKNSRRRLGVYVDKNRKGAES
ncbi:MAG TPA: hypothetical protein IAA58_04005 [Candidatus Gallacutalibacter stercoravium]|nr:hypothetical protein [Candidatus Gallacutalibacter stercoravium]